MRLGSELSKYFYPKSDYYMKADSSTISVEN